MQAIEIETDITQEGHIHLPGPLWKVFGRHARLILLLDDTQPAETVTTEQQPTFTAKNPSAPRADWFKGYQTEADVDAWETLPVDDELEEWKW